MLRNFEFTIFQNLYFYNNSPQAGVEARVCPENYLMMAEPGERFVSILDSLCQK